MDTGQRLAEIVQTQNIRMFSEELCDEVVPKRRNRLKRLLIEEENRFGFFSWQFDLAQRHIADFNTLVGKQSALIARMKAEGADITLASKSLKNLLVARDLFVDFALRIGRKIKLSE